MCRLPQVAQGFVIGEHGDDRRAKRGGLRDRIGLRRTQVKQFAQPIRRAVPHHKVMARIQQPPGHRLPHASKTYENYLHYKTPCPPRPSINASRNNRQPHSKAPRTLAIRSRQYAITTGAKL